MQETCASPTSPPSPICPSFTAPLSLQSHHPTKIFVTSVHLYPCSPRSLEFPVNPTQRDHSCVCSDFWAHHSEPQSRIPWLEPRHHFPLHHVKMKVSLATAKTQSSGEASSVCGDGVKHLNPYFRFSTGAK